MPFEKTKVLKSAEKFLAQGKIKDAIKEYRQVIDHDASDFTTLNMLGDLLARSGQKEDAIDCFERIADHYREEEFALKAIAMYKKIDKLKPGNPEIAAKLATLYTTQGLVVDARAQWLVVAEAYTKSGDRKRALKVLHKIADLDPNNTDVRLKLADGYLKERMGAEAAKAFGEAAGQFLESGQFEKALDAYSKVLQLTPNHLPSLRGVLSAHVALGTPEDAAELIEKIAGQNSDDPEFLTLMTEAYLEAENAAGAERAVATLVSQNGSDYRRYIEVARLYLKLDQRDEAARIFGLIIETMLAAREDNDLSELLHELLDRDPDHVTGLRLLARVNWWQRDMDNLRVTLERLAEAAQAAELPDEERYALTQLVRLAPDESKYAERLEVLGGLVDESVEQLATADDQQPTAVPTFESFDIVRESVATVEGETAAEGEFEFNSVAGQPTISDPHSSFADLNELAGEQATPETTEAAGGEKHHHIMIQELESVDFYITQGYNDIAADTLELLQQQFGAHPEITARREKLNLAQSSNEVVGVEIGAELLTGPIEVEPEPVAEVDLTRNDIRQPQAPPKVEPPKAVGIDSGLAEIFEEFRLEAEGEQPSSNEDFETHYNMATAYKEMELLDEAIREFQNAAALTTPGDGTPRFFQCCNMLGQCFISKNMPQAAVLWFKKGLETPGRSSEEYKALQYELGSAYEQMGDVGRALGMFTEVYGVDVGYRNVGEKLQELQGRRDSGKKKRK